MHFIVLWISYYSIVFNLYVFYCFMIFAVSDLHLDQYSERINDKQSKKSGKLLIYRPPPQKKKKIIILPFVLYTKWRKQNLTFRVDLLSQKFMWLRNGRSDFCKLGVKISVRLKKTKKQTWSGAAESAAVLRGRQIFSRGCLRAPPPPCS